MLLREFAIEWWFVIQPFLTNVSALPGETLKRKNCILRLFGQRWNLKFLSWRRQCNVVDICTLWAPSSLTCNDEFRLFLAVNRLQNLKIVYNFMWVCSELFSVQYCKRFMCLFSVLSGAKNRQTICLGVCFYRAVHYSGKCGLAIACLSVCQSVCLSACRWWIRTT